MKRLSGRLPRALLVFVVALVAFALFNLVAPPQAQAAPAATVTLTSWETMWLDSNKPADGPQAAFLSFLVTNTSTSPPTPAETLYDVTVTIGSFSNTTWFKNPTDTVRTFASLAPGESVPVYFYVDYSGATTTGLSATYTLTVASSTPGFTSVVRNGTVTTASALSANAGGSDVTTVLGPGIYVGQILEQTVTYKFGNNTNLSFQPVGISGFKDYAFRLVGNTITNIVSSKTYTGIAIGQGDRLYWPGSDVPDSGTEFTMVYYWEVLASGQDTAVRPWAHALSGMQYKYLYKTTAASVPAAQAAPLTVSKNVSPMWLTTATTDAGYGVGTVRYTVAFTNTSAAPNAVTLVISRITDVLPGGVSMVNSLYTGTSGEFTSYSRSVPQPGDRNTVNWVGSGAGHATRHYRIDAGQTLTLVYTAKCDSTLGPGAYTNSVTGRVGNESTPAVTATFNIGTPTLAVVSAFKAYKHGGKVALTWETSSEAGTAGFYVERLVKQTGAWVRVNQDVIPALFESPSGGSYALVDAEAKPGSTLTYRLVELETSGDTKIHGPYTVTASAPLPAGQASSEIAEGKQNARVPKMNKAAGQQSVGAAKNTVTKDKTSPNRLRIEVVDSGIYTISATEIATGLALSAAKATELIGSGDVKLTYMGKAVAYLPALDGSGIYFYGQAIDSIYTSTNVYWLSQGKGKIMTVVEPAALAAPAAETTTTVAVETNTPSSETSTTAAVETTPTAPAETTTTAAVETPAEPAETTTTAAVETMTLPIETSTTAAAETTTTSAVPQAATSFIDTLHVEKDIFGAPAVFHDPEGDFWLWQYMVAGNASLQKATISLDALNAVAGVRISLQLRGLNTQEVANEHLVEVRLNGTVLGRTSWSGTTGQEAAFDLPAGVLLPGPNTLEITALRNAGIALSVVAVDSVDLTYERTTVASLDQLALTSLGSGPVKVNGLSTASAWVFDIGTLAAPTLLPIVESGSEASAAWLAFDAVQGGRYLVSTAAGALHPRAITGTMGTTLRDARAGQYVIVTTSGLASTANSLAQYRASRGLTATVVTLSEIYDEFNYGIANPHAIQSFLKHARSAWKPGPEFLVLVGEGSYDYKNYMGLGDCLVPSLMVDTKYGLAPSDVLLGDIVGSNGVPEVAVGRIMAVDQSELTAAINKIKGYEAASGSWRKSVVFAADNADVGGNFAADSDKLAALVPRSLTSSKIYLDKMPLADARTALLGKFGSGALWINYLGHGGVDILATERLLTLADAQTLTAKGYQLPVVTVFSCVVGSYNLPGYSGMGETLVKRPNAGAIALWAPSAMEMNDASMKLATAFTRKVFASSSGIALGSQIVAAQKAAAGAGASATLIRTYNLLGDPALRLSW